MNRLIVAFTADAVSERVCALLSASSIPVRAVCKSGAEVVRMARHMGGGVVVCGARLSDMTADQLYEDLEGLAYLLVVAKPEQLEHCESPRIFRLPLPVNRYDLTASVNMLEQLSQMNDAPQKPPEERELILKAKARLQREHGVTEEEAHRLLQRLSMERRVKMSQIAAEVLGADSRP